MFDYDSNFSESSSQDHGNRRAESQNTGDRRTNSLPRGGKTSLNNANPKRYINQLIGVRVFNCRPNHIFRRYRWS